LPPERRTAGRSARTAAALVLAALAIGGCGTSALPVLSTLPDFTLTDQEGRPFGAEALRGSVWVADFVFTRCPDVCPAITARMKALQDRLPAGDDPIRLVSISVDPEHDTPAVLTAYAARFGARPGWVFLTGSRSDVSTLLRDGFKVAWADGGPPSSPITHSDRFALVDRQLRIRRYYHGTGDEPLDALIADAIHLRSDG
jgi:protein SCO1/2